MLVRVINGVASFVVALVISEDVRNERRRAEAWRSFWAQSSVTSTLNAVIERDGYIEPTGEVKMVEERGGKRVGMRRSGSDLFDRPSGFGLSERSIGNVGLVETVKMWSELGVEIVFAAFRAVVLWLLVRTPNAGKPVALRQHKREERMSKTIEKSTADFIVDSGYPLEEHVVTTRDGYVLRMQRLPRRDSKNVVFFQHGVLDTSLSWVCNGPGGSQAFAAYDAGADVWLGNCRSNPPRKLVAPGTSSYWAYSINELGMEDISSCFERIHAVKGSDEPEMKFDENGCVLHVKSKENKEKGEAAAAAAEEVEGQCTAPCWMNRERPTFEKLLRRKLTETNVSCKSRAVYDMKKGEENILMKAANFKERNGVWEGEQGYKLQVVAHSLGAASVLVYAVVCCILGIPHRISGMILLTPAGFHRSSPTVARPFLQVLPIVMRFLNAFRPGLGAPVYIPSPLLRFITFKLTVDLDQVPALRDLTKAALRLLFNGDCSEWDRALQMPHYAASSMPALSVHTGAHLIQLIRTGKFELYDYGSAAMNKKKYGSERPPDVSSFYHMLSNSLPIHLVAGVQDGVISRDGVWHHYTVMKEAGLNVTYKEFVDLGHLDLIFAAKDDVLRHIINNLLL